MAYVFSFLSGILVCLIVWFAHKLAGVKKREKPPEKQETAPARGSIEEQFMNMMRYTGEAQHDD